MALRRYKMYASFSATGNNQDSMQIPRRGRIKAVEFHCGVDSITDNALARTQVSKAAVGDWNTGASGNAVITQELAETVISGNFVTSGLAQGQWDTITPCNDEVTVGEMLYINSYVSGTIAITAAVVVVIDE